MSLGQESWHFVSNIKWQCFCFAMSFCVSKFSKSALKCFSCLCTVMEIKQGFLSKIQSIAAHWINRCMTLMKSFLRWHVLCHFSQCHQCLLQTNKCYIVFPNWFICKSKIKCWHVFFLQQQNRFTVIHPKCIFSALIEVSVTIINMNNSDS